MPDEETVINMSAPVEQYSDDGKIFIKGPEEECDCSYFEVKEGTLIIGKEAFAGNSVVEEIVLPESITEIQDYAFQDCISLKKIELPENLQVLGTGVFLGCKSIESIKIPEGIIEINNLFHGCRKLRYIHLPESLRIIGYGSFEGTSNLKEISLPVGLEEIGKGAFRYSQIEHIILPATLKKLGEEAFQSCLSLKELTISEGIEKIEGICDDCFSLEKVSLPGSLRVIGFKSFYKCNNLKSINIPEGVREISNYAFGECEALKEIYLPSSIEKIDVEAFNTCPLLEKIWVLLKAIDKIKELLPNNLKPLIKIKQSDMSQTKSNKIDSKSYVIITCGNNIDPEVDKIQLNNGIYKEIKEKIIEIKTTTFSHFDILSIDERLSVIGVKKKEPDKHINVPKIRFCSHYNPGKYVVTYISSINDELIAVWIEEDCIKFALNLAIEKIWDIKEIINCCTEKEFIEPVISEKSQVNVKKEEIKEPTFIKLKPGKNILTIEEYPDLKYGFKQIDRDGPDCCSIIKIDLSNFDGSAMTSMENMFSEINAEIIFGNLNTSNVNNLSRMFYGAEIPYIKMSFDVNKVISVKDIFWGTRVDELDLSQWEFSKNIKISPFRVKKLKLDGCELKNQTQADIFDNPFGDNYLQVKISMKDCDVNTIKWIAEELIQFIDWESGDTIENHLILDNNIRIKYHSLEKRITVHEVGDTNRLCEYSSDGKTLLKVDKEANFVFVKNGVKVIKEKAFEGCKELETVVLPPSVKTIEDFAFSNCKSLRHINIPDSVIFIGHEIFSGCESLKSIFIGSGLKYMGFSFVDSSLQNITMPLIENLGFSEQSAPNILNLYLNQFENNFYENELGDYNIVNNCGFEDVHYPQLNIYRVNFQEYPHTKDGCLIDVEEIDDDLKLYDKRGRQLGDLITVQIIGSNTLAVPENVQALGKECIGDRTRCNYLYIPDSVIYINPSVFINDENCGLDFVIIKKDYLDEFLKIIPEAFGNVSLRLI